MLQKYLEKLTAKGGNKVVNLSEFIFGGVIGKGGFGEVRKAVQISTQRYCASKQIFQSRIEGTRFKRYISEVETMLKCDNLFMVPLVGFTIEPPYTIITEYMPGGSLDKYTREKPKNGHHLTPNQQGIIAIGIANGMMNIHKQNIIHRDLKTANILLDSNLWPKICDFGISRFESNDHNLTGCIGTPQYMAPELVSSTKYDKKVDVYSYGLILYEMCELVKPFGDMTINEIFLHVVERGERLKFSRTDKSIRELITKCWAQDPNERPSFEEIYNNFATGKLVWPGSDQKRISKFIEAINIDVAQREEQHNIEGNAELTQMLVSFMEDTSKAPAISRDGMKSQNVPIASVLGNYNSPLFEGHLTYYSETIDESMFNDFYRPISSHLRSSTPPSVLNLIIRTLNMLMKRKGTFVKLLLDEGYFQQVPLDNECLDEIVSSFTILMAEHPKLVNKSLTRRIADLTYLKTEKMLVIISFFLRCENGEGVLPILDVLISLGEKMMDNNFGYLYIALLVNIAENSRVGITREQVEMVKNVFLRLMNSKVPKTRATVYIAMSKLFADVNVETKQIIEDISNEITREAALTLVAKFPVVKPSKHLYAALIKYAAKSSKPWIMFLRIADTRQGANYLINHTEWSDYINTRADDACKLFLVLLMNQEVRSQVLELPFVPQILKAMQSIPGDDSLDAISIIIAFWATSSKRVAMISAPESTVLDDFFSAAMSGSFKAKISALSVADTIGRICYVQELLVVAKGLVEALQVRELSAKAIQATSTLSMYHQCAQMLNNEGLVLFFKDLVKIPGYEPAARFFLKNIKKSE